MLAFGTRRGGDHAPSGPASKTEIAPRRAACE